MQEIYAAMRIKTHLNNDLYQLTAVCFEHEHELVIAESPAGSVPAACKCWRNSQTHSLTENTDIHPVTSYQRPTHSILQ